VLAGLTLVELSLTGSLGGSSAECGIGEVSSAGGMMPATIP